MSSALKAAPEPAESSDVQGEHALSSGHKLIIRSGADGEDVEIRSPEGKLEVSITVTAEGPVLRMVGGRVEMEATDTMALKARNLELQATETASMHSDGHLTMTAGLDVRTVAQGEVHVLGTLIWLN